MQTLKNKEKQIKKEDRLAGKKLLIIVIVAAIVGGFIGAGSQILRDSIGDGTLELAQMEVLFNQAVTQFFIFFLFASNLLVLPILICRALSHKKAVRQWDGENEEQVEHLEKNINIDLLIINTQMIITFICYGTAFYQFGSDKEFYVGFHFFKIIGFIFFMVILILIQRSNVNRIKEINPEKEGSVFDMRFNKKWFDSCDEAEKQIVAKVSEKTLRIMNRFYLGLTMGLAVLGFTFEIGLLPFLLTGGMWLVQSIVYTIQALKEKQRMPIIF